MNSSALDLLTEAIENAGPDEALRLYQALSTLATVALVRALEGGLAGGELEDEAERDARPAAPPAAAAGTRARRSRAAVLRMVQPRSNQDEEKERSGTV